MTRLIDDLAEPLAKAGGGVMVAFMLDAANAEKLKVDGGEDPKDMHVTLAYLGKPDALDMSKLPALERAVKAYAAQHAPVAGTIDGPVRFGAKPQTEGRDVVVAAFCNPGIQEFRAGLVAAIKAAGVDVPRPFDYRPHVCLKYIPTDAPMPVQRIAPLPVTFDAVTLSVVGARTSYPLSGTVVKYSPDQPRDDHGRWGAGDHAGVERDRIRAVLNASDSDPKVKEAEERNLRGGDSRDKPGVLDADGHYTPEADAENRRIADSFLRPDAKPAAGERPSAIFMVGKPGAGKSTTLAGLKDTLPNSVTINSDDIKEKLPGYTPDQAGSFHERSCDIARSYLTPDAVRGKYNIVFDMTDNSERLLQSINALKGAGYKVALIHSDVSDATSAERVYDRFNRTGRYVVVRTALSYSGRPKLAYDLAKPHVDQYREYDQNGKSPKLTDSGGGGVF